MSWWVPFAFVGAALVGVAIALSLTAGRPRRGAADVVHEHGGRRKSRYEEDNELVWNPAAFVTAAALVAALVLVGLLVEVL